MEFDKSQFLNNSATLKNLVPANVNYIVCDVKIPTVNGRVREAYAHGVIFSGKLNIEMAASSTTTDTSIAYTGTATNSSGSTVTLYIYAYNNKFYSCTKQISVGLTVSADKYMFQSTTNFVTEYNNGNCTDITNYVSVIGDYTKL